MVNSTSARKMNPVQAPIQTSMALTYETCGVSAFRPEKNPVKTMCEIFHCSCPA